MRHPNISRQEFLQQLAMAGTGLLLSSLKSLATGLPEKKIKIAVIGCGSVSNMYLPHLTKSPFVELVSACDIIYERAQKQAAKFNLPNHYPHIDQLLAGAPFDLLVNLTDMQEHGRLNKQALLAGKHVWSEKPMANTYKEGRVLLDLAQSKGLRLWGAPAVVNSPQFAFMSKAIQEGKLGKISSAHAHYGHLGPTWSAFFYEKGGGSLPDLGVYNLATLTGLLGPARSVMAMTSIWGTHGNMGLVGYDWAPFGVDLATVDQEKPVRYVPDAGDYVWEQGASVISEALATGEEPLIAAEHALHVLEIIEAARASGNSGKEISLQSKFKWPVV